MSDKHYSSGIGFWGLLTILFIGLKVTGYIDWSWWVVIGTAFVPAVTLLGMCVVGLLFVGVCALVAWALER